MLHNPVAIDYFYEYLEGLEELENEQKNSLSSEETYDNKLGSHTNNFRLLALYMDLRCYESVIRKVKESKRY